MANIGYVNTSIDVSSGLLKIVKSDRLGYWVVLDAYTGIGVTKMFNSSYNLYNFNITQDINTNQYFLLTSQSLSANGVTKSCTVLKQ